MARTKSISDEAVLDRLMTMVSEAGPEGLTFARAAKAAGLSAATLVQRYGNSQSMLEAVLLRAWDKLDAATRAADEKAPLTPQGTVDLLMALMPSDAAEYNATDGLLLLREDIRNPVLRARGAAWGVYLAHALGRRLSGDVKKAERLGWQMANV